MPTVQPIQQKPVIDEKELELQVRNSPIYVLPASHRNFFSYGFKQLSSLSVVSLAYRRPLPSVKKKKIGERGPFPRFCTEGRERLYTGKVSCHLRKGDQLSWLFQNFHYVYYIFIFLYLFLYLF